MKIMFLINSLGKGGAERVVVNLAEHFADCGYEVCILTARCLEEEYVASNRIIRKNLDLDEKSKGGSRMGNIASRVSLIRTQLIDFKPNILVSFIGKLNFYAIFSAAGLKIPVCVSVRSDPNREYATFLMRLGAHIFYSFCTGLILQTQDAKAFFPSWIQKKSVILPNSLDKGFVKERFSGLRKNEIVSVGRLDANKNHKILLEAFGAIHKKYPELTVVFYGDGYPGSDTLPQLKALSEELGISEKVKFMGRVTNVHEMIAQSRIFVLTSNVEGMPNALIEAMALGLAVVSTDCPCGGPKSVIQDGENGLLIPVGDSRALTSALLKILEDPGLEEKLGRNAHRLLEKLSPEKVNHAWQEYIESKL